MLSSKSPSSTDNVSNKKRKVTSPLVGSKSSKVVRLATKENLVRSIHVKEVQEDTSEKKLNSSNDSIEIISDDEKKDQEQSDQQKTMKSDSTPKRRSLGKNKLDRAQQKPGALTKFFKRIDREVEDNDNNYDDNLPELKDKKDYQDTSVYNEKNEDCLNESSDVPFIQSELQNTSQLNETNDTVASENADPPLQESDCDIVLSSDNETSSELNKSMLNRSKETETGKPVTPVTPKTDKDTKNKIKKLTPKQLEKRKEIARKKEEKLKLKMVCI